MNGTTGTPETPFSRTYVEARDRFRDCARRNGWNLESHPRGRTADTDLSTDVAIWGSDASRRTLVLSSGLHGVEGFFGSAVQLRAFQRIHETTERPADCRVVLIHALNPYGFAAIRRFDEANVDQNRNFLRQLDDYRGAPPLYGKLNRFLNPPTWPRWELPFRSQAMLAILRHGLPALKDSIAKGQYEYPTGLFFGGRDRCSTFRLLEAHLDRWLGTAGEVLHLDFHTGLGASGEYELYVDHPLTPQQTGRLAAAFTDRVRGLSDTDRSYIATGSLTNWVHDRDPQRDVISMCAEFGTHDPVSVLGALRAENAAHHHSPADSPALRDARSRLLEMFLPCANSWRQNVMNGADELLRGAVRVWGTAPAQATASESPLLPSDGP